MSPLRRQDRTIPVRMDTLAYGGDAVGKWQGLAVFVPYAVPGDKLRVRLEVRKKTYARGVIEHVEEPSRHRIVARCELFGRCGGCQWQMLPYSLQLEAKRSLVEEALERVGKIRGIDVQAVRGMAQPWLYRNKAQMPVEFSRKGPRVGYYARRSHRVIELRQCPIHHPLLDRTLQIIRDGLKNERCAELKHLLLRVGFSTSEILVVLVTRRRRPLLKLANRIWENTPGVVGVVQNYNPTQTNVVLGRETFALRGQGFFRDRLGGKTLQVSATSFFQVNPQQAEVIYQVALEMAEPEPDEVFLDAYCGVGGMAFYLAEKAGRVVGIEEVSSSIRDAIANAKTNATTGTCQFVQASVEEVLPQVGSIDGLVLDPPRTGCSAAVLREIIRLGPRKVIYISCDPVTLARDLGALTRGGYRVDRVIPVDLFPQTYHVETIVRLKR